MVHSVASILVVTAGIYLSIGLLFALAFVFLGAGRIDPAAARGTWGFRLLILPGSAALWPWLALRWLRRTPPPEPRDAHRRAARSRPPSPAGTA